MPILQHTSQYWEGRERYAVLCLHHTPLALLNDYSVFAVMDTLRFRCAFTSQANEIEVEKPAEDGTHLYCSIVVCCVWLWCGPPGCAVINMFLVSRIATGERIVIALTLHIVLWYCSGEPAGQALLRDHLRARGHSSVPSRPGKQSDHRKKRSRSAAAVRKRSMKVDAFKHVRRLVTAMAAESASGAPGDGDGDEGGDDGSGPNDVVDASSEMPVVDDDPEVDAIPSDAVDTLMPRLADEADEGSVVERDVNAGLRSGGICVADAVMAQLAMASTGLTFDDESSSNFVTATGGAGDTDTLATATAAMDQPESPSRSPSPPSSLAVDSASGDDEPADGDDVRLPVPDGYTRTIEIEKGVRCSSTLIVRVLPAASIGQEACFTDVEGDSEGVESVDPAVTAAPPVPGFIEVTVPPPSSHTGHDPATGAVEPGQYRSSPFAEHVFQRKVRISQS